MSQPHPATPMHYLDVTLATEIENIALDEALLETAEFSSEEENGSRVSSVELLRIWEPSRPVVVLGRSSPIETEVNLEFTSANRIPVVRRMSGGQSVVNGPGCLLYGVLLSYGKRPELRMLENAHAFVMTRMQRAIAGLGIETEIDGTSDLSIMDPAKATRRKVSGNSLRCRRNWLFYHGTMLCSADLDLISNCLGPPRRMPDYRVGRSHADFLVQLPTDIESLKRAIIKEWSCAATVTEYPLGLTAELVRDKYATSAWTEKI